MFTRRKYDLYYTLNTNVPTREFTKDEQEFFWAKLSKLDSLQSQAVVLLIYEHSLVAEKLGSLPVSLMLPYGGKQKQMSVSFDFTIFPSELKWILFKFFEVLTVPLI